MSTGTVCIIVSVVCFLAALIGVVAGPIDAQTIQILTLAGLAAFALGHLPWRA